MSKRTLRIRMDRSFSEFGKVDRENFLFDLAEISGCPENEIENIKFSRGCVIFDGELDREAVARLIEYFKCKDTLKEAPSQIQDFIEFCKKWSVTALHSHLRVQVKREEGEASKEKDAVVFIHGWRGDEESFGEMPSHIAEHVECFGKVYTYPSGLWERSPSIDMIARNFDNWIRNNVRSNKVALFAHSMGGLVARRFISLQFERRDRIDSSIKLILFIASPHNGAVLANMGGSVPFLQKAQLNELATDSNFLFSLNADWNKWMLSQYSENCSVRCVVGVKDSVVSINSAIGLDANPIPILEAGHIDIVKPASKNDEIVLTAARLLEEAGFKRAQRV